MLIGFFVYLVLQVVFIRNVVLFQTAFCFVYVVFLLLLPVELGIINLMFIGLAMGLTVDVFYDSFGTHASASVFIMFLRNNWLKLLTPQGGYDLGARPAISLGGTSWFLVYSMPLIFLHHALLFFIEAGGFHLFGFTTLKIIMSVIFTSLVMVLIQYIFPVSNRI